MSPEVQVGLLEGGVKERAIAPPTEVVSSLPLPARMPGFPPRIGPLPGEPPPSGPSRPGYIQPYIRPSYALNFSCIAGACEDTCCQGWGVPVDQGTYEKYRSHAAMKPFVGTLIVLNTNAPTSQNYARMPLNATGTCAFFDEDRMCGIQRQLGDGMLSKTCATYPRASVVTAGEAELALNLSCPEAARLTLLDPHLLGIGWRQQIGQQTSHARYAGVRKDAIQRPEGSQLRLMLREFALLLLTDRSYPLWQRLYLLGSLMRRLQAQCTRTGTASFGEWCDSHPIPVAHILAESAQTAASRRLTASLDELTGDVAGQIQMVMAMLRMRFARPPVATRFLECVQDVEAGLGCTTAACEQQIVDRYCEAYTDYYRPMMERHPHLIENCLLNFVFKNGYPFGWRPDHAAVAHVPEVDAEREHLALCVHAALVQTMLVGMAAHYRETFDTTHVVKLVQSLARAVEHSREFQDDVLRLASERKHGGAQGIVTMLWVGRPHAHDAASVGCEAVRQAFEA